MPFLNFLQGIAHGAGRALDNTEDTTLHFLGNIGHNVGQNVTSMAQGIAHSPLVQGAKAAGDYGAQLTGQLTGNPQATQNAAAARSRALDTGKQSLVSSLSQFQQNPGNFVGEGGLSEVGRNLPGRVVSEATAARLAKMQDTQKISKELTPHVGPVVADHTAAAIAKTNDPNIVHQILSDDVNKKLPTPEPPSPTPAMSTDITARQSVSEPVKSGQGSEQIPNKPFIHGPNDTGEVSHIGEQSVSSGMKEILNQGGSVDEAAAHYMDRTGVGTGEAREAVHKLIGSDEGIAKGMINRNLNPLADKFSLPDVAPGDKNGVIGNVALDRGRIMRAGDKAIGEMRKLSDNDLKLVDSLADNKPKNIIAQAEDPTQMARVAKVLKTYNDTTHAIGNARGQELPYRQNYGMPKFFDRSPENQATLESFKAGLKTKPGYTEGRQINPETGKPFTYDEMAEHGVQRAHENAIADLYHDVHRRAGDISQLTLQKGLEQAHPGEVRTGEIGVTPEGVYDQLKIPHGGRYSLPQDIAAEYNKRAPADEATGKYGTYKNLNAAAKDFKLVGGFHSLNETGNWLGQQITSGNIIKDPKATGQMVNATFSTKAFQKDMDTWSQTGTSGPEHSHLEAADVLHLTYKNAKGDIKAPDSLQADVGARGKLGNIPGIKQLHELIFTRQVPFMKLKILEQKLQGKDIWNNPEDKEYGKQIALELNQDFGGMNRTVQGLTPKQFSHASDFVLATDWTEGQLLSLKDALKKGGPDGQLARQVVFGKALLWAGLATAGGALGGEFAGKSAPDVAKTIIEKVADPSFTAGGYKIGLPATPISMLAKPAETTAQGVQTGNFAKGAEDFGKARLAAFPSELVQGASNQDYYGNPLYGHDKQGRPISSNQTAANIAGTVAPIPAGQIIKAGQGNAPPWTAAANTAGVKVTPQYDASHLPVGLQTYLSRERITPGYTKEKIQADTQFFAILKQNAHERSVADKKITDDIAKRDFKQANQDATDYNQRLIKALQPWARNNSQYMDDTLLAQLKDAANAPSRGLGLLRVSGVSGRMKTIKNNPEKYNQPITPL